MYFFEYWAYRCEKQLASSKNTVGLLQAIAQSNIHLCALNSIALGQTVTLVVFDKEPQCFFLIKSVCQQSIRKLQKGLIIQVSIY